MVENNHEFAQFYWDNASIKQMFIYEDCNNLVLQTDHQNTKAVFQSTLKTSKGKKTVSSIPLSRSDVIK